MPAAPRPVYRHRALKRLFDPTSIAIVGASPSPGAFGARALANLSGFRGRTYLVNAKYDRIGEHPCHPSLAALPEAPDCVVLAVPREAVEALVAACAGCGAGGVVVFASGYGETGAAERIAAQARLTAIARERDIRIVGPNTIGVLNYRTRAAMTFSGVPWPVAGHDRRIGLVSQSGALGFALAQAVERGVSFSHVLTAGNSCDVDVADELSYLADDPGCSAIACVFEGMPDPHRLLEAGDIARAAGKPIVIYKLATGEEGAAAALSHTASLAGSRAAWRAAFERAGLIVVEDCEALVERAAFFAKAPPAKARGVAVIATSGGASIMAADKAEAHGVPLPQPSEPVRATLEAVIPDFGSARNPCDVTAQVLADPASLLRCGEALMSDAHYGALVLPQVYAYEVARARIQPFSDMARRHGKITCNVWITEWLEGPGARDNEVDPHTALFRSMDRCFATLAAWHRHHERSAIGQAPAVRVSPAEASARATALLDASPHGLLTEREAKRVLAAYGIPVVEDRLARTAEEAVAAAAEFAAPVALKIESPDLPHKTEVGGIRLDLRTPEQVHAAFEAIVASARRLAPAARVNGVSVQPMVEAGVEVMIGARSDPLFGPLVVAGLGGTLVELLEDTAVALAPVPAHEARALFERLKGAQLLHGFRGSPPVDLAWLADIVCRVGELAHDQRNRIAEIDVNPLICAGTRIVAVDALIRRAEPG